jgi:hypothetical protein
MRRLYIPIAAVSAIAVASIAIGTGLSYAGDSNHSEVAHHSSQSNSALGWFSSSPEQANQAMHQSGPAANAPHTADGPKSMAVMHLVSSIVRPYVRGQISVTDIGTGPYAVAVVMWRIKNGGIISVTVQKVTAPLPLSEVTGSARTPVRALGDRAAYVTVDHSPFFRQVILVRSDGICINVTNAGFVIRHIKPSITMAGLLKIASAIALTRL